VRRGYIQGEQAGLLQGGGSAKVAVASSAQVVTRLSATREIPRLLIIDLQNVKILDFGLQCEFIMQLSRRVVRLGLRGLCLALPIFDVVDDFQAFPTMRNNQSVSIFLQETA